ncbi:tetraacyldisaccharide 4'-kinase [Novimethylophilus kurashikiensis]|uniref:Tetraacyldisaccharide 4'-kinase n=1 Tax=Novimethylophilus kurashikiensis TaxID=1825523 RepID=A0A2R5FIK3_9PROT|nr:tetraacyldisaccharide 4'-kinase [Novimethylophilus kurashikiensis]GBG15724.1 tetraacyldisaccharide 4'-kinase [Novimethylophilus kurashikiensis]
MPHSTGASSIKFSDWLQGQWQRFTPWQLLLLPFAGLFFVLTTIRRGLYKVGVLPSVTLPVPVVVVGNITVGGTGKTPLVLWLAAFLSSHGYRPGIISRGYGSKNAAPQAVLPDSDPTLVGDEPVLLAQRSGCPVWVSANRAEAGRALLAQFPQCDVILSDDGLQHYGLRRAMEIVVVDGARRFGNKLLLPAGPLRESRARLTKVDAVVINGESTTAGEYAMRLSGDRFRNLCDDRIATPHDFAGKKIHALAGIGNPSRFFSHLRELGLTFAEHPFPDHYAFTPRDVRFEDADVVLMTEKDAVKCQAFAPAESWALVVDALLDDALGRKVLEKLRK